VLRYAFMYHTNVTAAWKFLHNSSLCRCLKNGRGALTGRAREISVTNVQDEARSCTAFQDLVT
jgi:hypothetical protein